MRFTGNIRWKDRSTLEMEYWIESSDSFEWFSVPVIIAKEKNENG